MEENASPAPLAIVLPPFRFTPEELARAAFNFQLRIFLVNGMIYAAIVFACLQFSVSSPIAAAIGITFGLIIVCAIRIGVSRRFQQPSHESLLGFRSVTLSDSGLRFVRENGIESFAPWSSFQNVKLTKEFIFLVLPVGQAFIYPRRVWTQEATDAVRLHVKNFKTEGSIA